jgi:hypothetical protein
MIEDLGLRELYAQSSGKVMSGDPACPICGGLGTVEVSQRQRRDCECVIRARAIRYLTPAYAGERWIKSMKVESIEGGMQLLIQDTTDPVFKTLVKSFLLNTGMRYDHETATGYDVIQGWIRNGETGMLSRYQTVPLLLLRLAGDYRNAAYSETLVPLLQERLQMGLRTWVFVPFGVKRDQFAQNYQAEVQRYIVENFSIVPVQKLKA